MQQTILSSIKYICPGIFSVKTPWGSFPVSGYLPQDVAFWVVAYRRFDSFVVCKDRMVKRSKLRTRLGRAVVGWDEPVLAQFV